MIGVVFLIVSFWVWKTMRADYDQEDILTLSLLLAGAAWALGWGWKWWDLMGVLAGVTLVLVVWCKFKKWDAWEWADVVARASLVVGAAAALGRGWWVVGSVMGIGVLALWGLAAVYRKFRWYKSGKRGLVGLACAVWWTGVWMGLAPWQNYKVYLAAWIFVTLAVSVYLRAGYRFSKITWIKK